ncbi:hypothetical protein [Methylomagnum sp.]
MAVSYKPLFALELLHDYFADRGCRALDLVPTAECRRLFERYRLMFRPAPNGGTVSFGLHPEIDFLALFNETTPFTFVLNATDPLFGNYTDLPPAGLSPSESLFYFDNLKPQSMEAPGGEKRLLHPPGLACAHGPLRVYPKAFDYRFDPPARNARLRVSDALKKQAVWEARTPDRELTNFPVNFGDLPDGRYSLTVGRKKPVGFYLGGRPAVKQWGVVQIFAGGSAMSGHVPESGRVIGPEGGPEPKTFTLWFGNRRTLWRYHIFSAAPGERDYGDYQLSGVNKRLIKNGGGDGRIPFVRRPAPVSIQGRPAWVFESEQDIPLWQCPADEHQFTLKGNGGRSFTLPYAESGNTRLDDSGGTRRMCSEIFVYL